MTGTQAGRSGTPGHLLPWSRTRTRTTCRWERQVMARVVCARQPRSWVRSGWPRTWTGATQAQAPPPAQEAQSVESRAYRYVPSSPLVSPACPKRRKVQGKAPPCRVVLPGFTAIRPSLRPESRLSRELSCSAHVVDFKNLQGKPGKLLPLRTAMQEMRRTLQERLPSASVRVMGSDGEPTGWSGVITMLSAQ